MFMVLKKLIIILNLKNYTKNPKLKKAKEEENAKEIKIEEKEKTKT